MKYRFPVENERPAVGTPPGVAGYDEPPIACFVLGWIAAHFVVSIKTVNVSKGIVERWYGQSSEWTVPDVDFVGVLQLVVEELVFPEPHEGEDQQQDANQPRPWVSFETMAETGMRHAGLIGCLAGAP